MIYFDGSISPPLIRRWAAEITGFVIVIIVVCMLKNGMIQVTWKFDSSCRRSNLTDPVEGWIHVTAQFRPPLCNLLWYYHVLRSFENSLLLKAFLLLYQNLLNFFHLRVVRPIVYSYGSFRGKSWGLIFPNFYESICQSRIESIRGNRSDYFLES